MTDKPGTSSSSSSPPLKTGPLANLVLCPVCHKKYDPQGRKPTVLNCGHNFCLQCIFNAADNSSVVCPTCSVASVVQRNAANMGLPVNQDKLALLKALCSQCHQSAGVNKSTRGELLLCGACGESDLRDFRSDLRLDLTKLQTAPRKVTSLGVECEQALNKEVDVMVDEVEKNTNVLLTRIQNHKKQMILKLRTHLSSSRDLIQKASQKGSALLRSCPDLVEEGDRLLSASQLDLTAARQLHQTCRQQLSSVNQISRQLKQVHGGVQLAKERKIFEQDKVLLKDDIDKLNKKREASANPGERSSASPKKKRLLPGKKCIQTPVARADSGSVPKTDQLNKLMKTVLVKTEQEQT